jgi:3-methylcrotonyl-CoA carboxylase alpha subunit
VPVTPGYHGDDQSPDRLASEAAAIGYPVLIKAVMGGGGKGMRIVTAPGDFGAALEACQREAKKSFGDARVLLERYIAESRHVEVQVSQ